MAENLLQYCDRHGVSYKKTGRNTWSITDEKSFRAAMNKERFPLKKGTPTVYQTLGPHFKKVVALPRNNRGKLEAGRLVYL